MTLPKYALFRSLTASDGVRPSFAKCHDKGLLTTALGDARPERGGKPRRLVTPTREGVAAVRATMAAIHAMTRGVKI